MRDLCGLAMPDGEMTWHALRQRRPFEWTGSAEEAAI